MKKGGTLLIKKETDKKATRYTYAEALVYIEKLKKEGYFDKKYPVTTAVTRMGHIMFNDNCSILEFNNGGLQIRTSTIGNIDYRKDYRWIACERRELQPGDTAYATMFKNETFNEVSQMCKIIDSEYDFSINRKGDIIKTNNIFPYWFKLVRRD